MLYTVAIHYLTALWKSYSRHRVPFFS